MSSINNEMNIKITMAGCSMSGKTSLILRFVMGEFPMNTVNTITTTILSKSITKDDKKINFLISDTAGDPKLREMVLNCFSNADYAIVCYDISDSDGWNRAKVWIRSIRSTSDCRIILCGTKNDILELDDRGVRQTVVNDYSDGLQMDYFEVSAKTGDSIDEMFNHIVDDYITTSKHATKIQTLKKQYEPGNKAEDKPRNSWIPCNKCVIQ